MYNMHVMQYQQSKKRLTTGIEFERKKGSGDHIFYAHNDNYEFECKQTYGPRAILFTFKYMTNILNLKKDGPGA